MVVGIASYQDRSEAYPLDRKTLRKIVLRSFLVKAGKNGETAESVGWAWAMAPGLKKIHTDEADYALALGHHLEYVDTGYFLAPLVMGVMLAMEQQKADLETIRSVRTGLAATSKSLSRCLFWLILPAFCFMLVQNQAGSGKSLGVILFAAVLAAVVIAVRFAAMNIGYSQGTRIAEKAAKNLPAVKSASVIGGAFMIGAMTAVLSGSLNDTLFAPEVQSSGILNALTGSLPGLIPFAVTMLVWYMLERKNWSLVRCVLVTAVIAAAAAGFFLLIGTF